MNHVQIDKVSRYLPSSWNELTFRQLIQACSFFNQDIISTHFKLSLLKKYLGISKNTWNKVDPEDAIFLCETLNFLLEDVTLTKALVKFIRKPRFPFNRYYGPMDSMSSSTFGEFTKAQFRFEEYYKTKDEAILDEMIAVLFRRKKLFWCFRKHFVESPDVRSRFFDRSLAKRSKAISKLDPAIKQAILLFFSGVQKSLHTEFPTVYKPKPTKEKETSSGWSNLIISLADGKTDDQSLDRIMNSNLYNVFLGLEQKAKEYFEFIRKYPQND